MCVCVSVTETIKRVLRDYHERISSLEDVKFDLEYAVKKKDFEVEFGFLLQVALLRMIYCVAALLFLYRDTFRLRFQVHVSVKANPTSKFSVAPHRLA